MRKRRAAWRASHRGTKELDILVGKYAGEKLAAMTSTELDHFEAFLDVTEADLQSWLLAPLAVAAVSGPIIDDKFAGLVTDVRSFHGLT